MTRGVADCQLGWALAVVPQIWESCSTQERENIENWLGNSINEKKFVEKLGV